MADLDIAGIWATLARLPARTAEQRRADRLSARAHRSVRHDPTFGTWVRAPRLVIVPIRRSGEHWSHHQRRSADGRFA